ncbi:LacI family DNA-binding transcriptional regulator [Robertmurraya kyonggiensis]|uniref:LacI family DNA-binding transcriptional regulator n=1 Tax=Robertmurraya kyonggiensis TaxID=1037680 RepID=A0A4U1DB41_9BACI|nr:LacI family DNA-binding transcriptional regulator [Robertmurraya kyonggiensis]TKC18817.1 LacI family DNA-binding transcriptional regulator [Robertmurraya kyonggiensis]
MTNIKDLAKMAGVSVTTVSRVLNEHPYVSEKKRMAVLEAIKATNYHKNINAVHLSKGNTLLMGVVLPFTGHPYFASLLKGIARIALEHDYKLVLFQTDYLESRELDALLMLKEKQIDSLIICSRACSLATIEEHLHYGSIVLCENIKREQISTTFVNHYSVFFEALEYLYQKGHQKIGYCIGRRSGSSSKKREQAYKDFLVKYDLHFRPEYIMDNCLYVEDAEKIIKELKTMEVPPTALLVTNDQIAAGVVTCCHNEGIAIPDELAIIGFDNQPIAKMMNITTIDIPHEQMGENLFLQAVGEEISHTEVKVKLIERGTV